MITILDSVQYAKVMHIERILIMALNLGASLRKPWQKVYKIDKKELGLLLAELDKLGTPFAVQNCALMFINEINDQKVYECLYSRRWIKIAQDIVNGAHFNDLIKKGKK